MLKCFPITDKCNICYETFEETKDETVVQLICGHPFHYDCILESYKTKLGRRRECPYCRKDGGWLPLLEGSKPVREIHQEWKCHINKIIFNNVNKKFKTKKGEEVYCPKGMCKGFKKACSRQKKFNGVWMTLYDKCTTKAKKGSEYCGRHKDQELKPLMKGDSYKYMESEKIYDLKTIKNHSINWVPKYEESNSGVTMI